MQLNKTIWVLEDDPSQKFVFEEILGMRYETKLFDSLQSFSEQMDHLPETLPNLVLADLRLPDGNFLNYISTNSHEFFLTHPLMIVSSMDDLDVLRSCFASGAHDYLTKPFSKNELIVKVERLLNTNTEPKKIESTTVQPNDIEIDLFNMQLKKDGETFATLTVKELQIFTILFKNFNQYVSRKKIFEEAWKGTNVSTKTLDVHLFNLRKKIINSGLRIRFELPDSFVLYSDPREAN